MSKFYVGLATTFHDPAVSIIDSKGEIIFAEATERYLQNKRARGCSADLRFWIESLIDRYCDPQGEYVVAKTWSSSHQRILKAMNFLGLLDHEKIPKRSERLTDFFVSFHELLSVSALQHSVQLQSGGQLIDLLRSKFHNNRVQFLNYPHHLCHAATACYGSPFSDAACMIVDGQGEGGSITYFQYRGGKIELVERIRGAASLGILYMMVTKYCGFDPDKGEEWKVMGLAPYGKLDPELLATFRDFLKVKGCAINYEGGLAGVKHCLAALEAKARPSQSPSLQAADMAYTGQYFYAEIMSQLLASFHARGFSDNLVLGGGCALNSAFNGQIIERSRFKQLFIPSAPADDGNAIGAALLAYQHDHPGEVRLAGIQSPYLGSSISAQTLQDVATFSRIPKCRHLPETICDEAAALLTEGKLLGWVQGRAEFGPRALGNRSILADPRPADMKDRINSTVKFREEFRPFAPSILHEYGCDYFENYQESPYMERTLRFKPAVLEKVPAVAHVDSTGRLQTVKKEWNERFHALITAFHARTGIPILLNTSFNIMGKPIIHSVEDAIAVFFTTGLDALVIGDYLIEK
jgi:carbamoyltransferase